MPIYYTMSGTNSTGSSRIDVRAWQMCATTSATGFSVPHPALEVSRHRIQFTRTAAGRRSVRRARVLLLRVLSPDEREAFLRDRAFIVRGGESGRRYRIRLGRFANVDLLDDVGKPVSSLCAHPAGHLPDEDTVLAQKLMLEGDEGRFLRAANRHPFPSEWSRAEGWQEVAR